MAARGLFGDGSAYERYVGRWSRLIAERFLCWIDPDQGQTWLDVGCGTGALSEQILKRADPHDLTGIDPSPEQVDIARTLVTDPRATFSVGNALSIDAPDNTYEAVVSGLVLNFIPDPKVGLSEMARVVVPDGTVAAYVWDYGKGMEMMRHYWDAAIAVSAPGARERDEASIYPLCTQQGLQELWSEAGLEEVSTVGIEIPTVFKDFDDLWQPFLAGVGTAPAYNMELDAKQRDAIRDELLRRLPVGEDGSISLRARVWAVKGTATGRRSEA